jgi:tetratricopeptide (TPR) repeat protein
MKNILLTFFILSLAFEVTSQSVDEIREIAISKAKAGDHKGAILLLDKAVTEGIANDYIYVQRGYYRKEIGDMEGAIQDFDIALKTIAYNWGPIITARGQAKHALGRYEEAIADYTKIIDADSRFVGDYYFRGLSKLKIGDKEGACADFKIAAAPGSLWFGNNYSNETKIELFRNCE